MFLLVWVRPTWVTDESTTELYETAVARRAPARLLNSQQATKLFLLGAGGTRCMYHNFVLHFLFPFIVYAQMNPVNQVGFHGGRRLLLAVRQNKLIVCQMQQKDSEVHGLKRKLI